MDPFYLCNNPEIIFPPEIIGCICSNQKPYFFAIVERIGQATAISDISYKGENVIFSYGLDGAQPQDYLIAVTDNINNAPAGKLNKVLKKAAAWFVKVKGMEANARSVEYAFLHDFSPGVPALQLIRYEETAEFLLSFGTGVKGFKTLPEAEEFMIELLRLPEDMIRGEVVINAG